MVDHLNSDHPSDLLVGPDTGDDAAVWRIADDRALVSTADFITPVVDDARAWGRVAAANSVSDVYAICLSMVALVGILVVLVLSWWYARKLAKGDATVDEQ